MAHLDKTFPRTFVVKKPLRLIDLFAGAGGLSLGFKEAFGTELQIVWANDNDRAARETYNANFGHHCVEGDILDLLNDPTVQIPEADIVAGGPPCQGFSLLNKNRQDDPRRHLWRPFLEVVERADAAVFVMENVPQLLQSDEYAEIETAAKAIGFHLASATLHAVDYGVPQSRRRAFIIGCRAFDPSPFFPPAKTHLNPDDMRTGDLLNGLGDYVSRSAPWRTVRDEIGDLPPPVGTDIREEPPPLDLHFVSRSFGAVSQARFEAIPDEGMNRYDLERNAPHLMPRCWLEWRTGGTDLFGRLWWDRPAYTIRTEFYKPEKGRYLHPSEHRPITHREAARLQSFPDDFRFCGRKADIARQIGNAVPPRLAERVAGTVLTILDAMGRRSAGPDAAQGPGASIHDTTV
jgi:DNA (cytosine-5)-methyltransferase 1